MLFRVGKVKFSQAILQSDISAVDLITAFSRYIRGDWGDGDYQTELANDLALVDGKPIIATYTAADGQKFGMSTDDGVTLIRLQNEMCVKSGSVTH